MGKMSIVVLEDKKKMYAYVVTNQAKLVMKLI